MKPEDEIIRAQEARRILESDVYIEAWQGIKDGIVRAMSDAPIGDEKTHHKLVIALQIVNKLQKELETIVQTGRMAEIELEKKSLMQRFLG